MKWILVAGLAVLMSGCSTLNDWGIGGEPELSCQKGQASIDDRLVGSDRVHLSMVRRMKAADALCKPGG